MLEISRYVSRLFLSTDKLIPAVLVFASVVVLLNETPGSGLYVE